MSQLLLPGQRGPSGGPPQRGGGGSTIPTTLGCHTVTCNPQVSESLTRSRSTKPPGSVAEAVRLFQKLPSVFRGATQDRPRTQGTLHRGDSRPRKWDWGGGMRREL